MASSWGDSWLKRWANSWGPLDEEEEVLEETRRAYDALKLRLQQQAIAEDEELLIFIQAFMQCL